MTEHLVIYGKGGVGKSTLTSNLSAALAADGYRVLQIGCDLKDDSCSILRGGERIPTILDVLRVGHRPKINEVVVSGFNGVHCVEIGEPAGSCIASGIKNGFQLLRELKVLESLQPDVVLYDVPNETLCMQAPISLEPGTLPRSFVVTSSDFMSLYTVNIILQKRRDVAEQFVGLIANALTGPFAEAVVTDYADKTNTPLLSLLPRSLMVMQCELYGKTVLEAEPQSSQAFLYRKLAGKVLHTTPASRVQPFDIQSLKDWARNWGARIYELEAGIINKGEGI